MPDERIDIEIRDKVSSNVAKKLLRIATVARNADANIKRLKKSLSTINTTPFKRLADIQTRMALGQQKVKTEIEKTALAQQKARMEVEKTTAARQRSIASMHRTTAARQRAIAATKRAEIASLRLRNAKEKLVKTGKKVRSGVSRTAASLGSFLTLAKAYVALRFAQAILRLADAFTILQNKLKNVVDTEEQLLVLTNEIFEVSRRSRTSVLATAQAFQRFDLSLRKLGNSQEESLRLTETLNKLLLLSGATTQEQSSALLQLSQAFNEGRLRGQEFRIISQTMPKVLDQIADSAGVTRGELKKMSADGRLTVEVLRDAISELADETDERFAKLTPTLGQAWTVLKDSAIRAFGEINKAFGITDGLSTGILSLADNLVIAGDYFVAFSQLIVEEIKWAADTFGKLWNSAFEGTILEVDSFQRLFMDGLDMVVGFVKTSVNWIISLFSGSLNTVISAWKLFPNALEDIFILANNLVIGVVENMVNAVVKKLTIPLELANEAAKFLGKDPIFDLSKFDVKLDKYKKKMTGALVEIGAIAKKEFKEAFGTDFIGKAFALIEKRVAKIRAARKAGGVDTLRQAGEAPAVVDPKARKAAEKRADTLRKINRELDSQLRLTKLIGREGELQQRFDRINNKLLSKKITLTKLERNALKEKLKLIQTETELQSKFEEIQKSSMTHRIEELERGYALIDELRKRDVINEWQAHGEKVKIWNKAQEERLRTAETFFGHLSGLQNSENKKQARIGRAAAIAGATIDTYKAATGAYASLAGVPYVGPALGAAAAAAAISVGLANVQRIRNAGSFQDGGVVPGTSFTGDNLTARVNSGEMVLNRAQQSQLFNMANGGTRTTSNAQTETELNVFVENYGSSEITVERINEKDVRIIARDEASRVVRNEAPSVIAADMNNSNSRVSKSLSQNTNAQRRR